MDLEFFVPGVAQPAGSKRSFVNKQTLKSVVTDANPLSKDWKHTVRKEAGIIMDGMPPVTGPIALTLEFFRARPRGHYNALGIVARRYLDLGCTTKPDALKLARGVEDALTGVVYVDDAQVTVLTVVKHYAPYNARNIAEPGVRIRVTTVGALVHTCGAHHE